MNRTHAFDRQAAALIMGSALILLFVAGLVGWQSRRATEFDPLTNCIRGHAPAGEVVVLLDLTDPLSTTEQRRLSRWLVGFQQSLNRNERLEVWTLGIGENGGLERIFRSCYPGREDDPIFHNPTLSAARCDSLFDRPLRTALAGIVGSQPSSRSPILEAVFALGQQSGLSEPTTRRSLVLVSDLVQHSAMADFYRSVPSFVAFERLPAMRSVRADLRNVAVDVLYLPRGEAAASISPALSAFWEAFFKNCGASAVRIERL